MMREKISSRHENPAPPAHGGDIIGTAKTLGCGADDLIDMSSNLSPLGPPDGLLHHLHESLREIAYLPETANETLTELFAAKHGLQKGQILAGNGTTEFIFALPAVLSPRCAVIINPTYSDYHRACQCSSVPVRNLNLEAENGFRLDLNRLESTLSGGELVFICNPNNPTGSLVPSADLLKFIEEKSESFFVIDESYLPFCMEPSLLQRTLPNNLFLLQSYSKIHTIPGLRLGFLIGPPSRIGLLHRSCRPWGVNRLAQLAGAYLLAHGDVHARKVRALVMEMKKPFIERLASMPCLTLFPGAAHFILCRLKGSLTAGELREMLLQNRIIIRNCANIPPLDARFFRLSLRGFEDNQYCLRHLEDILRGSSCE